MPDIATAERYLLVARLEREKRIMDYHKLGLSNHEIGKLEGLSSSRVRAIILAYNKRIASSKVKGWELPPALFRAAPHNDGENRADNP